MDKKNFKLGFRNITTEQRLSDVEAEIEMIVNGVDIFKPKKGQMAYKEQTCFILKWIPNNFQYYTKNGMPEDYTPAINFYKKILDDEYTKDHKYWEITKNCHRLKPELDDLREWIWSHIFNYPYLDLSPIIFQRRNKQMEISWDFVCDNEFENPNGCEYIPFKEFKEEIYRFIEKYKKLKTYHP